MNRTFGGGDDSPTLVPLAQPSGPVERASTLPIGTVLAERYQIIDVLGIGGMGAVYRTFDRKLTRVVALKTILPELAATPSSLKRFKQEVLSAQSIVHRNVVRIFDIGEDGATTFITMDFIEGVDLKSLIKEKGKLPIAEASAIIRQVCEGLEAAHAAGVVHRDLKPQNIMIEKDGHVVVMDFGLAHSDQSREATQTGMFLGTPDYMSPEQAKAESLDLRSDIFSLGLICYELMTGKLPYHGKTVVETMYKRTTERAIPPAEIEQSVPEGANDIVVKCLQIDREQRYQSVTEILEDLETFDPKKKVGTAARLGARLKREAPYRKIAVGVGLVAAALLGGILMRNRDVAPAQPAQAHAPVTLFIADFSNHTGDPLFDNTLEPVVKLALEDAGFITAFDRRQMSVLGLKPATGRIDDLAAQQIAVSQGLGAVVVGSLDQEGDLYAISVRATQAVTGKSIASVEAKAKKDQVLFETTKLASALRKALGDDTSDSAQRFAMETLTATSLEAIHEYALAMEEVSNGRHAEALTFFSKAAELDPNFGIAYTGMANMSRNLGRLEDAERYSNLALQKIDRMTEREKLRTRGSYYLVKGNQQKCIEEYSELVRRFPSDAAAHNNLAVCSEQLRQLPKAIDEVRLAAAILPKKAMYRNNLSLYASYASDFQTGEKEALTVQQMDAAYETGYIALAFAQLGQGKVSEAADTFRKLGTLSKRGASKGASGLADLAIYEGRFREGAEILKDAAAADLAAKDSDNAATKLAALAHTHMLRGDKRAAIMAAESALESSKIVKVRFLAGRILAAAGQTKRAQEMADELSMRLENEPQAYGRMIEGEIALQKGDPRLAIKAFKEANGMAELWIGHFQLGRAYLEAGAFVEADSEFDRCMKRRGEALALFVDESPTYGYFPQVLYYLGRARQGLKSAGFAELYKNYLSIREKPGEDPLIADIKKRLAQ